MGKLDENTIVEKCFKRWSISDEDERTALFRKNIPLFLEGTSGYDDMIEKLLDGLFYYSHKEINKHLKELYDKIKNVKDFDEGYAIYSILKSLSGKMNSSTEYLLEFCLINEINKNNRYTDIDAIGDLYWNNINTIVLIDDFCGSGNTFIKFLKKEEMRLQSKKVIYAVVHIMNDAIEYIRTESLNLSIEIEIVFCEKSDKAFGEEEDARQEFVRFSKCRGFKDDSDILGYELSEALLAFYNNTPNNTLGIIRKKTANNIPLFPRKYEPKPAFMLDEVRQRKEKRKISNYNRGVD